jgi:hypothetical protein
MPYQWATAGYMGAIESGKTICGILFGGAVYLGYLSGVDAAGAPEVKDPKRKQAIASVRDLFQGFIDKFGNLDCTTLTGCDWSKKEDINRYLKEEIYIRYVLSPIRICSGRVFGKIIGKKGEYNVNYG